MHAGVVAGPAGAILLPAPPGSGKSTLTAGLVAAGLDYFSDEVALLAEDDLAVMPFPLAMCVKDTGIDALAALFPAITALPMHTRMDGKRVVYMPPPAARVPASDTRRASCRDCVPPLCGRRAEHAASAAKAGFLRATAVAVHGRAASAGSTPRHAADRLDPRSALLRAGFFRSGRRGRDHGQDREWR